MDPITQGIVGAALAQTKGETKTLAKAGIIGALASRIWTRNSTDKLNLARDFLWLAPPSL
ncbi:MAG: hypothetical protein QNK32_08325 [Porticoccus sp.]|nr:hypothetical protein [Porticoccus sp.]